jgi:predicted transposase YbfD/YdcC
MDSMQREQLREVFSTFEDLTDPRREHQRLHDLFEIVVMALCASLAGCDDWVDVQRFAKARFTFFRRFLKLKNGIPSDDTFRRVFQLLDTAEFIECVRRWMASFVPTHPEHLAVDGKTLCGSRNDPRQALKMVTAWAVENGVVFAQTPVPEDSNEIPAILALVKMMNLKKSTVTIDAIGCQHEIVEAICDRQGDFLVSVKANQPTLHDAIRAHFERGANKDFRQADFRQWQVTETIAGVKVTRHYVTSRVPAAICRQWPEAKTIGMVTTTHDDPEKDDVQIGQRFYLSSLDNKVQRFARLVRNHWKIENQQHWTLDVTYSEDRHQMKKLNGPLNCGVLRRLSLSLLKRDTSIRDNLRGKRTYAALDENILLTLLQGFSRKK